MADATELVEQHWPYDGPHTPDTVHSAADTITALVRYMNNATGPVNGLRTLEHANDVDRILTALHTATEGLPQLLTQLAEFVERESNDGVFYDDRAPGDPARAVETAQELLAGLDDVRSAVHVLSMGFTHARRASTHLGNNEVRRG